MGAERDLDCRCWKSNATNEAPHEKRMRRTRLFMFLMPIYDNRENFVWGLMPAVEAHYPGGLPSNDEVVQWLREQRRRELITFLTPFSGNKKVAEHVELVID